MAEESSTSKFLMTPHPKHTCEEDPTPFVGVEGAILTTGRGSSTDNHVVTNGDTPALKDVPDPGGDHEPARSVSVAVAAVMLVAEMAGSGVLSLPRALANTGWGGMLLLVVLGLGVGLSGSRLGLCWVLLEKRYPQYRTACRTPYPVIGEHALGRPGKILVIAAQNLTLVGVTTVFLIMSGDLLQALLGDMLLPSVFGSHCYCTLIVGAVLVPLSWLGTPKDFWHTAVVAMVTTVLAVVVVIVQLLVDAKSFSDASYSDPSIQTFFLGFGTILFSFGGAATFPTIQNDMRDRAKFPYSVGIAFIALLLMYLPISSIGYGVVGGDVPSNILRAVSGPVVQLTQALVVLHLLTAYVILVNPVTQGLEQALNIPAKFCWQRCLVRTLLVLLEVLIGLAVPDFGKILNLVGASTVALMSFVLPPVCYLRLSDECDELGVAARPVPYYERVILFLVLIMGLLGGMVATWSAVASISEKTTHAPDNCLF